MSSKRFLIIGIILLFLFLILTITAKYKLTSTLDFTITVKLQDYLKNKQRLSLILPNILFFAGPLFSSIAVLITALIFRKHFFLICLLFIVITSIEIYGKYELQHPPPPHFFAIQHQDTAVSKYYVRQVSSYPSGHAARSIYLATLWIILINQYFNNMLNSQKTLYRSILKTTYILLILLFTLTVGFTKIYLGEHWTSDVIAGWLLGSGSTFIALLKPKRIFSILSN